QKTLVRLRRRLGSSARERATRHEKAALAALDERIVKLPCSHFYEASSERFEAAPPGLPKIKQNAQQQESNEANGDACVERALDSLLRINGVAPWNRMHSSPIEHEHEAIAADEKESGRQFA